MNTNQLQINTPDILDEEAVKDRVNRIITIGHDKTLTEEERVRKIVSILEEVKEEEEEEEEEEIMEGRVNQILMIRSNRTVPDEQRLQKIQGILQEALATNGESDARTQLKEMNATTDELLAIAMREKKLPENIGACGTVCNNSCQWCSEEEEEEEEEEQEEQNFCHRCGHKCVSYTVGDQINWLCEKCYYGENDECSANETGVDWNESGYCD